jgi:sugar lactone lactonase YvrE
MKISLFPNYLKPVVVVILSFVCQTGRSQPSNDFFANSITLSGTAFSVQGSNVGATAEPGEPNHGGLAPVHSVWWTWTAPATDAVRLSTYGSTFSTVLDLYTGNVISNLTDLGSDFDTIFTNNISVSELDFMATAGTSYQICVDGVSSQTGSITLNLLMGVPLITNPPSRIHTVSAGTNVVFTVGAFSSSPVFYQWLKNGTPISGATQSALSLTNVQIPDGGDYTVVVSNSVASAIPLASLLSVPTYEPYQITTLAPRFNGPDAIVAAGAGNLFVAEASGQVIKKLQFNGTNWTTNVIAGSGTYGSTDGTNLNAKFASPNGIALDAAGSLYTTDGGSGAIRRIAHQGTNWVVTTLAHSFGFSLAGLAVDSATNIFIVNGNLIEMLSLNGTHWVLGSVAGGAAGYADGTNSAALFNFPECIAADSAGNLYVGDNNNQSIRKIVRQGTNWVVTTLAGNPFAGGTDAAGTNASFAGPDSVAVDRNGNVYVGDWGDSTIRKITPTGVVTTLAGISGSYGAVDGIGSAAILNRPDAIAVDSHGNLYFDEKIVGIGSSVIRIGQPVIELIPPAAAYFSQNGGYQFGITLPTYQNYRIQASSDLTIWQDLTNIFPTTMSNSFLDTGAVNQSNRFYRVVGP